MRKNRELTEPLSCLNRAKPTEMLFVLLGRDAAAPEAIRYWVRRRIQLGKNERDDVQIKEALNCAAQMELEREQGVKHG